MLLSVSPLPPSSEVSAALNMVFIILLRVLVLLLHIHGARSNTGYCSACFQTLCKWYHNVRLLLHCAFSHSACFNDMSRLICKALVHAFPLQYSISLLEYNRFNLSILVSVALLSQTRLPWQFLSCTCARISLRNICVGAHFLTRLSPQEDTDLSLFDGGHVELSRIC